MAEPIRAHLSSRTMRITTSADGRPLERLGRDLRRRRAVSAVLPGIKPTRLFVDLNGPSTRPVDPDVVPTHGDVIVSDGSGDEVSAVRT
jgi:hypothetical protein